MKTTNDPNQFIKSLQQSTKVQFDNGHLKAEVSRIEERNSRRQIMIRYSEWINGRWQSFSHYVSPFAVDVQNDFLTECKAFSISN